MAAREATKIACESTTPLFRVSVMCIHLIRNIDVESSDHWKVLDNIIVCMSISCIKIEAEEEEEDANVCNVLYGSWR